MSGYEQRNHNFYKGMTDAQFAYNEAERRVVELEDENAKLREDIRDLEVCYQLLSDRLGRDFSLAVQTDVANEKLQKLVQDMWPFAKAGWTHTCPNRECYLFEECVADSVHECPIEEHMAARMRKLGIEVDE